MTDKVILDVGGKIFTTTKMTLNNCPNTFFSSPIFLNNLEADKPYFIDRNGEYFTYILEYLRNLTLPFKTFFYTSGTLYNIYQEAKYYNIESLCEKIENVSEKCKFCNIPIVKACESNEHCPSINNLLNNKQKHSGTTISITDRDNYNIGDEVFVNDKKVKIIDISVENNINYYNVKYNDSTNWITYFSSKQNRKVWSCCSESIERDYCTKIRYPYHEFR
jgi:hypothetical protein